MGKRLVWLAAGVVFALVLGVGSAGGRSLATTTLTIEVIGKGTVKSSPSGVKCGNGNKSCYIAFTGSGTVTLTANPSNGWNHGTWGITGDTDCAGSTSTPCNVTLDGTDHQATANFTKASGTTTSTLSVSATGPIDTSVTPSVFFHSGDVTGGEIDCGPSGGNDCNWVVPTDSTLTVHEAPQSGYVFTGWGGECSGTDATCTVEMEDNKQISAAWADAVTQTKVLTVNVTGGGKVEGSGIECPSTCAASQPLNASVTLTASPKSGYIFTSWSGACASSTATTCTFTMTADSSVTATFALITAKQLTVNVTGNGNISGGAGAINCGNGANICTANLALGATVTLIATPATGATFTAWTDACGGSVTTCTVLMSASRNVNATFTGGPAPGTATVALSVSVTGNGTVTGGGIRCGNTSTVCTANQVVNAIVTLTAAPDPGATFAGWGGACFGTSICSVTMTTARSVTATFTGGTAPRVELIVTVTGKGSVKGAAISCGNGLTACSTSLAPNTTLTLTATPAAGRKFNGWGGACFGTKTTCTVTVTTTLSVTASFTGATTGGGGGTTGGGVLTALSRPLVRKSAKGYLVTLRFKTTLAGTARVRGTRAGRLITSLAVHVRAGNATIGPFPVAKPGFFTFEVRLGTHALRWRTCLGLCGAASTAPRFVLTRQTPIVTRTGVVWSVTLRFRENAISDAHVIVRRGGKFLSDHHFLGGARAIIVGPFLLGPGNYTLRLRAVDAYGRVRTLSWFVDLAR